LSVSHARHSDGGRYRYYDEMLLYHSEDTVSDCPMSNRIATVVVCIILVCKGKHGWFGLKVHTQSTRNVLTFVNTTAIAYTQNSAFLPGSWHHAIVTVFTNVRTLRVLEYCIIQLLSEPGHSTLLIRPVPYRYSTPKVARRRVNVPAHYYL